MLVGVFFLATFLLSRGKQHRYSSGILILVTMKVHQRHTNLGISKLGQFPTQNQSTKIKRKQGDLLLPLGRVNAHITWGIEVTIQRITPFTDLEEHSISIPAPNTSATGAGWLRWARTAEQKLQRQQSSGQFQHHFVTQKKRYRSSDLNLKYLSFEALL